MFSRYSIDFDFFKPRLLTVLLATASSLAFVFCSYLLQTRTSLQILLASSSQIEASFCASLPISRLTKVHTYTLNISYQYVTCTINMYSELYLVKGCLTVSFRSYARKLARTPQLSDNVTLFLTLSSFLILQRMSNLRLTKHKLSKKLQPLKPRNSLELSTS